MAKIWPVYEGRLSGVGPPWAQLPLRHAIDLLELRPEDHLVDMPAPRFESAGHGARASAADHVLVEVDKNEVKQLKWKPGFYKSKLSARDVFGKLLQQVLVEELGEDNVVRVEYSPTIDSRGQDALKIVVIIAPDAAQRLANGAALDALVRLRQRLRELRDDRTPIIEYATEADLEQDGGP
jgi:hypothetical protein